MPPHASINFFVIRLPFSQLIRESANDYGQVKSIIDMLNKVEKMTFMKTFKCSIYMDV